MIAGDLHMLPELEIVLLGRRSTHSEERSRGLTEESLQR